MHVYVGDYETIDGILQEMIVKSKTKKAAPTRELLRCAKTAYSQAA